MTHESYDLSVTFGSEAMPKQTFFNLDDAKRGRLMAAAREEFASHEYAEAKLDRIAAAAGVPKGSLYQYFEGKEDFYVHTVQTALDEAWEFFLAWIGRKRPRDCFALIEASLLNMLALKEQMPQHAALYARVVFSQDAHAFKRLYPKYLEHSEEFYSRVIPWGIESGDIDPDLPEASIRFQINALGRQFQYFVLCDAFPEWIPEKSRDVKRLARRIVDIHRRSLAPKPA